MSNLIVHGVLEGLTLDSRVTTLLIFCRSSRIIFIWLAEYGHYAVSVKLYGFLQSPQTPVPVLRRFVRATYVPEEYPSTVQNLYDQTPDEAIPEFVLLF